jgi:hypothetical protein
MTPWFLLHNHVPRFGSRLVPYKVTTFASAFAGKERGMSLAALAEQRIATLADEFVAQCLFERAELEPLHVAANALTLHFALVEPPERCDRLHDTLPPELLSECIVSRASIRECCMLARCSTVLRKMVESSRGRELAEHVDALF